MEIVDAGRFLPAADGTARYEEQLRVPALSVGTYSIPAGAVDDQEPHAEDEIYVVLSGRGIQEAVTPRWRSDAGRGAATARTTGAAAAR